MHSSRNGGVGARAESALLPTAGYQGTDPAYITASYQYGTIRLTGQSMKASQKTAFAQALATEMEGIKTDCVFDLGRQSYGEANGIIGMTGNTSTSCKVYPFNRYAEPGQPGGRYFKPQSFFDGGTIANPDVVGSATGVKIISVSVAANSGTLYDTVQVSGSDANMSATAEPFMFNHGAGGAGLELKGIRAIIDDQTATNCYGLTGGFYNNAVIFNIDRDLVPGWNSTVDQNSGVERIIDSFLMQKVSSKIQKAGGQDWDIAFGEYDVVDALLDSVRHDRRFSSPDAFDAGGEIAFNGKSLIRDLLAPYNELFLIHKPSLKWYTMCPMEFADDDGSILKHLASYDIFEAYLRSYIQLAVGEEAAPNTNGVIRDVKVDL